LGNGDPLTEALHHVRTRMLAPFPNEWYRPVLYLRAEQDDGGRILDCSAMRHATDQAPATSRAQRAPPPAEAVFKIDFSGQEKEFHQQVERHRGRDNPQRQRPLVFIIPGWTDEVAAGYLLERLLRDLEKNLPRFDADFAARGGTPIGKARNLLINGTESPQGDPVSLASPPSEGIRASLFEGAPIAGEPAMRSHNHPQPLVFFAHVKVNAMRRGDPLDYLRAFCDFWGAWGDQRHLLLVCLFLAYPDHPCTWLGRVLHRVRRDARRGAVLETRLRTLDPSRIASLGGTVLPLVTPVRAVEVRDWARKLKDEGVIRDGSEHFQLQSWIDRLVQPARGQPLERDLTFRELWSFWDEFLTQTTTGRS
jgi:hypothetical protein